MAAEPLPFDARCSRVFGAIIGFVLTLGITWGFLASPLWGPSIDIPVCLVLGGIAAAVAAGGYAVARSAAWERLGRGVVLGAVLGLLVSVAFAFDVLLVIGRRVSLHSVG